MPKIKPITIDEQDIMDKFYYKTREVLKEFSKKDGVLLDIEVFKYLVGQTNFKPSKYDLIFKGLPEKVKCRIKSHYIMNEEELIVNFRNTLNVYRQEVRRLKWYMI